MAERLWRLKAYWQLCLWLVAWLSRISSELPDKKCWASTIWISWSVCSIAWTKLFRVSHLLCRGSSDVDVIQWAWTLNPGTIKRKQKDWTYVHKPLFSEYIQRTFWFELKFTIFRRPSNPSMVYQKSSKWLIGTIYSPWLVFVFSVWE